MQRDPTIEKLEQHLLLLTALSWTGALELQFNSGACVRLRRDKPLPLLDEGPPPLPTILPDSQRRAVDRIARRLAIEPRYSGSLFIFMVAGEPVDFGESPVITMSGSKPND